MSHHLTSKPTRIRLKCTLQLISGKTYRGFTHEISLERLFMECQSATTGGGGKPKDGDQAIVTLYFVKQGEHLSIKTRCRIFQVLANGIAIIANFSDLSKEESDTLKFLLKAGSN